MQGGLRRVGLMTLVALGAVALIGASAPGLSPRSARPGLWDVSHSATGAAAERVCLADPMILTQWEHRGGACTRVVLSEHEADATIHYTCAGRGFGQSTITLLTPRSLRIDTQGISNGLPFAYSLHARRAGDCPRR
jgi:hypothetical protein